MNKKQENKKNLIMMTFLMILAFAPTAIFAQDAASILRNQQFNDIITIGITLFTAWQWIGYFSPFNPDNAFKGIVVPGISTFLIFQWDTILGLFL